MVCMHVHVYVCMPYRLIDSVHDIVCMCDAGVYAHNIM